MSRDCKNFLNYRIYLDACCLNCPFDDLTQPRIALEAQAVLTIIHECETGQSQLIASAALEVELAQMPNREKLNNIKAILAIAKIYVNNSPTLEQRSLELRQLSFGSYNALHLASAEQSHANIFLSTDDRLVNKAKRYNEILQISVDNPVQ
ncbi:hypothetical protein [Roseofilum sp. Guam]|uniref:hypothetical protein n=1 Tax=Roseofilum sp. Guam TaxID=2821502 RepID=UPI001B1058C8|nr:hypothetical protein [Roseofilum sp. Guam]MBP0030341.1 PIN domain-containing protein [Roseofilum sp. Guam]